MPDNNRKISKTTDISPGVIFTASTTLPHSGIKQARPFLAIKGLQDQVIALPLTSLSKKQSDDETYKDICARHHRKETNYFPISPNVNGIYVPISPGQSSDKSCYSSGWVDLITPMTLGAKNISFGRLVDRISPGDLERVIDAHINLTEPHKKPIVRSTGGSSNTPTIVTDQGNHAHDHTQNLQQIRNLTTDLLLKSQAGELTTKLTEKSLRDIIAICENTNTIYPPSPPMEVQMLSPESPTTSATFDLPASITPSKTSRRRKAKRSKTASTNGTCTCNQFEARKYEDDPDSGGNGPNGGGSNGGGPSPHCSIHKPGNKDAGGNGSNHGTSRSSAVQEAVGQEAALEWTMEDWDRMECLDHQGCEADTAATEEIQGDTWELLNYESSCYSGFSDDSGVTSSLQGCPNVEGWVESLQDPESPEERSQHLKNLAMILNVIQAFSERVASKRRERELECKILNPPAITSIPNDMEQKLCTPNILPQTACGGNRLELDPPESSITRAEVVLGKQPPRDTPARKVQKPPVTTMYTCSKCKSSVIIESTEANESFFEKFCEKCKGSADLSLLRTRLPQLHQHQDLSMQGEGERTPMGTPSIERVLTDPRKLIVRKNSPRAGSTTKWYPSWMKRILRQANFKEQDLLAKPCGENPLLQQPCNLIDGPNQRIDDVEFSQTITNCDSEFEGEYDSDSSYLGQLDSEGPVYLGDDFDRDQDMPWGFSSFSSEDGPDYVFLDYSVGHEPARDTTSFETKYSVLPSLGLRIGRAVGQIPSFHNRSFQLGIEQIWQLLSTPRIQPQLKKFLSRSGILRSIRSSGDGQNPLLIYGIPGVGKTQLALKYARTHHNHCDSPFFITTPGQEPLPLVHTIVRGFLNYIHSVKEPSESGCWKDVFLEAHPSYGSLPQEPLLQNIPRTGSDSSSQALSLVSFTSDIDLFLERMTYLLVDLSIDDDTLKEKIHGGTQIQAGHGL